MRAYIPCAARAASTSPNGKWVAWVKVMAVLDVYKEGRDGSAPPGQLAWRILEIVNTE